MLAWARLLLSDTAAAAVVNGNISPQEHWLAGVRQGCPLAPAMYLFVAWALSCWLRTVPEVGVWMGAARVCAPQYADDTTPLLRACTAQGVEALLAALHTFAQASGQRLNTAKSKVLPVGPHPLEAAAIPSQLGGVEVAHAAKTLGILFTNEGGGGPGQRWQQRLRGDLQQHMHEQHTLAKQHLEEQQEAEQHAWQQRRRQKVDQRWQLQRMQRQEKQELQVRQQSSSRSSSSSSTNSSLCVGGMGWRPRS